jgi:hypothetical protein
LTPSRCPGYGACTRTSPTWIMKRWAARWGEYNRQLPPLGQWLTLNMLCPRECKSRRQPTTLLASLYC